MMIYEIVFHPEAWEDLKKLDNSVKIKVLKQIKKLSLLPELGEKLGKKYGLNLTGFRKLYVNKKQIRIVYRVDETIIQVFIIGIGKRESEIYIKSAERINN